MVLSVSLFSRISPLAEMFMLRVCVLMQVVEVVQVECYGRSRVWSIYTWTSYFHSFTTVQTGCGSRVGDSQSRR